jgi:hypothetical protein
VVQDPGREHDDVRGDGLVVVAVVVAVAPGGEGQLPRRGALVPAGGGHLGVGPDVPGQAEVVDDPAVVALDLGTVGPHV